MYYESKVFFNNISFFNTNNCKFHFFHHQTSLSSKKGDALDCFLETFGTITSKFPASYLALTFSSFAFCGNRKRSWNFPNLPAASFNNKTSSSCREYSPFSMYVFLILLFHRFFFIFAWNSNSFYCQSSCFWFKV